MTTLGILGGGHIARMMAQAAGGLAVDTIIFSPTTDAATASISPQVMTGNWHDESLLKQFAEQCDVVTLENGSVSSDILQKIENFGTTVYPSAKTTGQVQDRVLQLRTMQAAGIDVPRFRPVQAATDVMAAIEEFGFPLMLKARRGSHTGSIVVRRSAEVPNALETLQGHDLYAEEYIPFVRELAVTVARGRGGEFQFYPVVEVVRQNQVYHTVRCPAAIDESTAYKATEIAKQAVEAVDGVGVFGVELFELEDNEVVYHKTMPYPHDAGLYSLEGSVTSQFANHLRAVLGLPLGDVYQIAPATVSIVMLADRATKITLESIRDVLATGGTQVHVYRSSEIAAGQVAGHVTVLGYATDGAEKVGLLALSRIHW